jgi:hypothetical protein
MSLFIPKLSSNPDQPNESKYDSHTLPGKPFHELGIPGDDATLQQQSYVSLTVKFGHNAFSISMLGLKQSDTLALNAQLVNASSIVTAESQNLGE